MSYHVVYIENGSCSNGIRMRQTLQKLQVIYPHMQLCTVYYHKDCPYVSYVEEHELPVTLLFRDQYHVCRMKGSSSYEFVKLWLEEKILEDGGSLEELS